MLHDRFLRAALIAGLLLAPCGVPAQCDARIDAGAIDALVQRLQPRADALAQLAAKPAAQKDGSGMWLQVMVRGGVLEQIGQLQVLRLLVELQEAVTGADNKRKVGDASAAVLRTIRGNAEALRGLVEEGRKVGPADPVVAELVAVRDLLDGVGNLGACRDSLKKETPASGR